MELGNANDNQPKMDEELADMIAGEWWVKSLRRVADQDGCNK
jgi:hypothetical protein